MPCNRPLPAWYSRDPGPNGKNVPTFTFAEADTSRKLELPCGRCMGCRLEKARAWAVRLMHEAKCHNDNHFVTLSYDDDQIPPGGSLRPEDYVLFMKRLRKKHPGVRYYQCGEYGDTTERPHHHALLFNCQFNDLKSVPRARDAHALFTSAELEATWQKGIVWVGAVTFESAAYVASYVTKKITGEKAAEHYRGRVPEYATMSRRPGITRGYYDRFAQEVYEHDEVIVRGHAIRPPKYYDRLFDKEDPDALALVKLTRQQKSQQLNHRQRGARETNAIARLGKRDAQ